MIRVVLGLLLWAMLSTGAFAQQGFDAGGLNTCSQSGPSASPFASTCYGYVNGVPSVFVAQPATMNKKLQIANGQWGSLNVGLAIDSTGNVTMYSGGLPAFAILGGTKTPQIPQAVTCTSQCNVLVGPGALANFPQSGYDFGNIAIGWYSLNNLIPGTQPNATENVCIGFVSCAGGNALFHNIVLGAAAMANTANVMQYNIAIGDDAMHFATTTGSDIAIGDSVLTLDTGKGSNTVIGAGSMKMGASQDSTSGGFTVVGASTLIRTSLITTGKNVVAIGDGIAGGADITSLNADVFIGHNVANSATNEGGDVIIGNDAGANIAGGNNLTVIGAECNGFTSGDSNTHVGACLTGSGKASVTTGIRNLELGADAAVPTATASNQMSIANFIFGTQLSGVAGAVSPGKIGIGTMTPNAALVIGSAGGTNDDGHLGFLGTAPALTACGTGSPAMDATANDASGVITEGTAATGCVATFAVAYNTAPHCIVSSPSGNAFTSYTTSTTALTLVNASLSGAKYAYICTQ